MVEAPRWIVPSSIDFAYLLRFKCLPWPLPKGIATQRTMGTRGWFLLYPQRSINTCSMAATRPGGSDTSAFILPT